MRGSDDGAAGCSRHTLRDDWPSKLTFSNLRKLGDPRMDREDEPTATRLSVDLTKPRYDQSTFWGMRLDYSIS